MKMTANVQKWLMAFADIAGSTHLYEALGDVAAKSLVTDLQSAIARVIRRHGGQVQEIVGDEVLFRFREADAGAACACDIQWTTEAFGDRSGKPLTVRIGLHYGRVIMEDGRLFGDALNTAARVADIAQGGQIIATEEVIRRLQSPMKTQARRFDEVTVKGKRHPLVVFDLPWKAPDLTEIRTLPQGSGFSPPCLTLQHDGQRYALRMGRAFTLGRDAGCDLVTSGTLVSRRHATIDLNRGRFMFTDTSTNGSYIRGQGGEAVYLRREGMPLSGRGEIALGAPFDAASAPVVMYEHSAADDR